MAINTKKRRKGATAVPQPASTVPFPDGTVDIADRGSLSGEYVPAHMTSSETSRPGFVIFGNEDCFTWKTR